MHKEFNWEDKSAAHEYRLQQARYLINQLKIDVTVIENSNQNNEDVMSSRAFVNIETPDDRYYTTVEVAFENVDLKLQVLNKAKGKISSAIQDLNELENMAEAVSLIKSAMSFIDDEIEAKTKEPALI